MLQRDVAADDDANATGASRSTLRRAEDILVAGTDGDMG